MLLLYGENATRKAIFKPNSTFPSKNVFVELFALLSLTLQPDGAIIRRIVLLCLFVSVKNIHYYNEIDSRRKKHETDEIFTSTVTSVLRAERAEGR